MKLNIIPTKEFIEKLEYVTKWFTELHHGEFVINTRDSFRPIHRVGNFTDWLQQQFLDRFSRNHIPMWGEVKLLLEAYPNIEKLEFVGVCPEYIRDMGDTLTSLYEIFREFEVNRGPVKAYRFNGHIECFLPKVELSDDKPEEVEAPDLVSVIDGYRKI